MNRENIEEAVKKAVGDRQEVVAVYLYGSLAEGREHERSDIDLALLMGEQPEGMYELEVASEIYRELEDKTEVDVRILNDSGMRFKHQVLKNGEKIYVRDREKVAEFEEDFYRDYLDKKPLIEQHDRIRRRRMKA